jgi:hypothetical protein
MTGLANTIKILGLTLVLSILTYQPVSAASMSVTVAQQTVSKGDTFIMEWYLDTQGKAVNVVDATLYYSPETLNVEDVVTGSSALVLWIEGPREIQDGMIRLVGGIPAGVTGAKIPIVRTVFRATASGTASIALGKDAKVVLSDGVATMVPITMEPIVFPVVSAKTEVVRSTTHPREDRWYQSNTVTFTISEKNPVVYSLSAHPEITPGGEARVVSEKIVYDNLRDGVYYFKVAAPVNGALQELQTRRVLIDRTAPTMSAAEIDRESEIFGGKPSLSFYAIDKTSGIAEVHVKTGWFGLYRRAESPYQLHKPLFGNVVKIRATDKVGNDTVSTLYFRGYLANSVSYCVILAVLICLLYITIRKRASLWLITKKVFRRFLSHMRSSS